MRKKGIEHSELTTEDTSMSKNQLERPDITLDNYSEVYDYFAKQEVDPYAVPAVVMQADEKYGPSYVLIESGANEKIAELIDGDARFVVNISHLREPDTEIATKGLAQTAFRRILSQAVVFAKDEHFRTEDEGKRTVLDKLGLPVFHPKRYPGHEFRLKIAKAAARASALATKWAVEKKRPIIIHGEGERNTKDKTTVQQMRALLGRVALGIKEKDVPTALLSMAIAYPDPESSRGAVLVIGTPRTDLPDKQNEFAVMAQDELQRLADRGYEEIEELLRQKSVQLSEELENDKVVVFS